MNLKDYKEIAKIVKEAENRMAYGKGVLSKSLADYFEREANNNPNERRVVLHKEYDVTDVGTDEEAIEEIKKFIDIELINMEVIKPFNREQFLSNCGVK